MAFWKRSNIRNMPARTRNEELESLYVFGYQCKLFQDDEKARFLDQGRHLIPWMGDASLMIDRYDGRGHLHDLEPYDSENVSGQDSMSQAELEEIQKIDDLCDEERYMELHTDMVQKAIYEEEELKRLNEAISDGYSAVAFNYEAGYEVQLLQAQEPEKEEEDEEDEPYYAPPELQLPANIMPPTTLKINAIIEKTALFISKHSGQMEIMIKTKQKDNAQFGFLDYTNPLNPYYKHMVKMLKSGLYKPMNKRERKDSHDENLHSYLHPSLTKTGHTQPVLKEQTREEFMISVAAKVPSGQIANTPYAKLLSNLSKHTTGRSSPQPSATGIHRSGSSHSLPQVTSQQGLVEQYPQEEDYSQHYQYSQPPIPGMEPVQLPNAQVVSNHGSEHHHHPAAMGSTHLPGLGAIAEQYTSTHDSSMEHVDEEMLQDPSVHPPPLDLQPVIDKMAMYVAKNGPEFEVIVRRKNDRRFDFLNAGHVHNPYYEHKKELYQKELGTSMKTRPAGQSQEDKSSQNKSISFSLRTKEPDGFSAALRATALVYESSEDEDEESDKEKMVLQPVTPKSIRPQPESIKPLLSPEIFQVSEELEKKQAEARLMDKLSVAVREKLVQSSKEDHIKAERKRKAAMFINLLKNSQVAASSQENYTSSGMGAPTVAPEMPMLGCEESPSSNRVTGSPDVSITTSAAVSTVPETTDNSAPVQICSPSIPHLSQYSRSKSKSPKRHSRSRSPWRRSKSPWQRSRSRSRSPTKRRRRRSKTPPSSYHVVRSPKTRRPSSHSKTPLQYKSSRRSRSKSRRSKSKERIGGPKPKSKRSRSRSSSKRSRSRSKTCSKRKSRSRSRTRKRSTSRSRKHRSRSRSKSRKSKSKKSKKSCSESRSPTRKRSRDSKKDDKKSKSSKSSSKSHSKKHQTCESSPSHDTVKPEAEESEDHTNNCETENGTHLEDSNTNGVDSSSSSESPELDSGNESTRPISSLTQQSDKETTSIDMFAE